MSTNVIQKGLLKIISYDVPILRPGLGGLQNIINLWSTKGCHGVMSVIFSNTTTGQVLSLSTGFTGAPGGSSDGTYSPLCALVVLPASPGGQMTFTKAANMAADAITKDIFTLTVHEQDSLTASFEFSGSLPELVANTGSAQGGGTLFSNAGNGMGKITGQSFDMTPPTPGTIDGEA